MQLVIFSRGDIFFWLKLFRGILSARALLRYIVRGCKFVSNVAIMPFSSCLVCGRPSFLFGNRDVESGWVGWCLVCNWRWRFAELRRVHAFGLLRWVSTECGVHACICEFLGGDDCYARWHAGDAEADLREIHRRAYANAWRMVLASPKSPVYVRYDASGMLLAVDSDDESDSSVYVRDDTGGMLRPVDSDDESDSGVMMCELNFVNPLWKMVVARPLRDGGCTPFDILIRFLGKPFEAQ
jgi:hypothetical protein